MTNRERQPNPEVSSVEARDRAIDIARLGISVLITPYAAEYLLQRPEVGQTLGDLPEKQQVGFLEGAVYYALVQLTGEKSDEGMYLDGYTREQASHVDYQLFVLLNRDGRHSREATSFVPKVKQAGRELKQGYVLGHFTPKAS